MRGVFEFREYKEIITLVVFFLGGLFWLQRTYPDRDYVDSKVSHVDSKISQLNCLLTKNIEALDTQQRVSSHKAIVDKDTLMIFMFKMKEASLVQRQASLSQEDQENSQNMIREAQREQDEVTRLTAVAEDLTKSFKVGVCGGAS